MEKQDLKTSIYPIKSGPYAGKYAGYVEIPTEKGEIRNRPTRYGKDANEVMRKLGKLMIEIENGEYSKPNKSTLIGFLKEYHNICAGYNIWDDKSKRKDKSKWELTTAQLYKMYIDVHYEPYFKEIKLIDIKPMTLDTFYNYKLNNEDNRKNKMSINTVIKLNKFLKAAFNYAVINGLIKKNPTDNVILGKKEKYEPIIYDENQFLQLLEFVKDKYDIVPIVLGAGMGFRRGEIFGLTWNDIDFINKTISINKTIVHFNQDVEKSPKNITSNRVVTGPEYVFEVLSEYKNKIKPVNDKENILNISPSYYSHRFKWLLEKFSLPHIRLHDLRHYNAVVMMERGIPDKVAAERLGHSDVTTLRQVYQHVLKKMDEKAASEINEMFKK
jgi:integrase